MKNPTGSLEVEHNGKTYELRLTPLGIGRLQARHGRNVAGIFDATCGDIPDMLAVVDIVSEALQFGEGLPAEQATAIANLMVAEDMTLLGEVVAATFPTPEPSAEGKARRKVTTPR